MARPIAFLLQRTSLVNEVPAHHQWNCFYFAGYHSSSWISRKNSKSLASESSENSTTWSTTIPCRSSRQYFITPLKSLVKYWIYPFLGPIWRIFHMNGDEIISLGVHVEPRSKTPLQAWSDVMANGKDNYTAQQKTVSFLSSHIPYAPCIVYLPTFGWFHTWSTWVFDIIWS